jgi:hypothetical protein
MYRPGVEGDSIGDMPALLLTAIALLSVGHADPGASIPAPPRWGQALTHTTHRGVSDLVEGGRPTLGPPDPQGDVHAWSWPDHTLEHLDRYDSGGPWAGPPPLWERRRCDPAGRVVEVARWQDDRPLTVRVLGHGATELDVGGWRAVAHGPWTLWTPTPPQDEAGVPTVRHPLGVWLLDAVPGPVDATSAAFLRDLARDAGGVILDVAMSPVDGHPAARVTVDLPALDAPRVAEVWVLPSAATTWTVTFIAPRGDAPFSLDTLAPGRATMLLASFRAEPP